jgi:hypothetical protein
MGCEARDCTITDDQGNSRDGTCLVSTKEFTGDSRSGSAVPGDTGVVTVNSRNGTVDVVQSNSTSVNATFSPFVVRAHDTPDSEILEDFAMLNTDVVGDGTNVNVTVSRDDGAPSTLGAHVVVELPVNFTGQLIVDATNGAVDVDSVNAGDVQIFADNGSLTASIGAAPLVYLSADNGNITAGIAEASQVRVESGNGDITASIGAITEGAAGGPFTTSLGDITLDLPGTASFTLEAFAPDEIVDFGTLPAACMEAVSAETSKSLTCGAGGTPFTATAGDLSSVFVSFH